MFGHGYGEASSVGQIFCIGATRELAGHMGSRMAHLSTGQKPAQHIRPLAA
jgi:hypothetical protein